MALPDSRNLSIYKGDTFSFSFRLRAKNSYGVPADYVDLTGATAKAQIRATEDSNTIIQEFTCVIPDQTVPENKGKVILSISAADTGASGFVNGVWDVQLTWPDNTVRTYLRGTTQVIKEVTRV